MYISVLIRRLRPGRTYEEFVKAWYPDTGYGIYEVTDEFDFSTDETVAEGRPS